MGIKQFAFFLVLHCALSLKINQNGKRVTEGAIAKPANDRSQEGLYKIATGFSVDHMDSNFIGGPAVTVVATDDVPTPAGVWVANGVGAVLVLVAATIIATATDSTDPKLGYASIVCYLVMSVLIDTNISASSSEGTGHKFEPLCAVILVEIGKLVASCVLYTVNRVKPLMDGQSFIDEKFSVKDALYLAAPGFGFALNNVLVWMSIGHNEIASFGVFRDTIVFFNAAIWCIIFKSALGLHRNLALAAVFAGLCINQITPLMTASLSPWVMIILAMAMTNALSSVANEYAIKQNGGVDLNLQNAVLYSFCFVWACVYLAISKPEKLSSVGAFFENFNATFVVVIGLQLCAGLLVSRILKYADSVTKNVANALRGPILIFLAPFVGLHSRLDILTGLSAVIVATAAGYFLMQGRPAPGIDFSRDEKK